MTIILLRKYDTEEGWQTGLRIFLYLLFADHQDFSLGTWNFYLSAVPRGGGGIVYLASKG